MGLTGRDLRKRYADGEGRCPICHKDFKGGSCPHSRAHAEKKMTTAELDDQVRATVRDELARIEKERSSG